MAELTNGCIVMADSNGFVFTVGIGAWIREKQAGSTAKRIRAISGQTVICESLSGHRTAVHERNLGRYRTIKGPADG